MHRDIEFKTEGQLVRGRLFLPDNKQGPFPIVVMGGGWCYVKEIVLPQYAEPMVANGFAVLTFDYRHFGESEGEPRQHLDPNKQIEDFRNAITYAATLGEIDANHIAVWGISYAGGHVLIVGGVDPRVKAIISIVPLIHGHSSLRLVHGYGMGRFAKLQKAILQSRIRRTLTGEVDYMAQNSLNPDENLCTWPFTASHEYFARMKSTVAPRYENRNTVESAEMLLNYSVLAHLHRIETTPLLMIIVAGDEHTPSDLQVEAFAKIPSPFKEMKVLRHMTHIGLYSNQDNLKIAAQAGADFVSKHMGA